MFIRNAQSETAGISDISDISKTRAQTQKETPEIQNTKISGFTRYLSGRKYYILVFAVIYITGLLTGAVLAKNLEQKEAVDLCFSADAYFNGSAAGGMTARIFGAAALNLIFLSGIYLSGITVFAPLACFAFCFYRGLSGGFAAGVYMLGGATLFHLAACAASFVLWLFLMVFFILACGEAMSFAAFLFKSGDSFRSNMSLKNISVYSSRFFLFLILISMAAIIQTAAMHLFYAFFG
ncbi:MAG: hypothetical protein FWH10_06040 [Oscillospiraceae bacterium]|nr:hypothetical protein [Oscillospiraceae bacterium]